ncbi:MAG: hypothetical protein OXC15_19465, partial [Rhodospirillaceae bacterium]|nr:hypothetical protein [Rhodospirillaceae bacterium]
VLQRMEPLGDRRIGRIAENLGEPQHGGQLKAIGSAGKGGRGRCGACRLKGGPAFGIMRLRAPRGGN